MPWDIPLDREQTSRLIEGTGAEISAVNYANRVLVSGRTADIEKARIRFEENGIPVNAMNVETAGHCCLVDGILDGIENAVRKQSPTFFRTCQHVPIGVGTHQPVRR